MTSQFFDERGFGPAEHRIPWTDLRALAIRTTASGPWVEDVFWMFLSRTGLTEIPGEAMTGAELAALQAHLPGIDNGKIIRAMGCAEDRMFRIWHPDVARAGWGDARCRARFGALVERLGGDARAAGQTFEKIGAAWGETTRRYHDRQHLAECLHQLDLSDAGGASRDIVELALWFHDAVYVAGAPDNEESSAKLLLEESGRLRLDRATAEKAAALVRATAHEAPAGEPGPEEALMLDIDLSILGADPLRFMEYEYAIEEEFENVPRLRFRIGRGRFLASLLARPTIFRTDSFRVRYEAAARAQLSALLDTPRYRAFRLTRWLGRVRGQASPPAA
jgi:predicted metal-dependent HD superfamily phosphohydrolase